MNRAWVIAGLGLRRLRRSRGALAGRGVKDYRASLRKPLFSPPLWLWFGIGALYYVACFLVIYRLIGDVPHSGLRSAALILVVMLMSINAGWNYIFFRTRNLFAASTAMFPYNLVAIALLLCLVRLDVTAALVFTSYLAYLMYANFWGYQLWQLNR